MKAAIIIITLIALGFCAACTGQEAEQDTGEYSNAQEGYGDYPEEGYGYNTDQLNPNIADDGLHEGGKTGATRSDGRVVWQTIMSGTDNAPFARMPLPESWKIHNNVPAGNPTLTGVGGVEGYSLPGSFNMYSNDPMTQQAYQYSGTPMRAPIGIKGVIHQELKAKFQQDGSRLLDEYDLPLLAQKDREYRSRLFKVGQSQDSFQVMGTDWIDKENKKFCLIIHYSESVGMGNVMWGYYMETISANPENFEKAKIIYINALANIEHSQQHIDRYNQRERQKQQSSMATHNENMQNNQRQFEARQKIHRETNDAINQSSMNAYNDRNASSDRSQQGFVNSMREETTVQDPSNGNYYQVDANANQNWMNGNGEVIQSNDAFYNPNQDHDVNQYNWEEAPASGGY